MPDIVVQIVTRMLATERTARYPTYKSLISDMRKAVHELGDAPVKTSRLGGKQIKFKNKSKRKISGSNATDSSSSGLVVSGQKKIVIRKEKGHSAFKINSSTKSKTYAKAEKREAPPPEDPQKRENARKKDRKALVLILLFYFVIIGGGIGINSVLKTKRVARQKRIEFFTNKKAQKNAATLFLEIDENVKNVAKLIPKTKNFETTIRETVLLVTGQEFSLQPSEGAPVEEPTPDPNAEIREATAEEQTSEVIAPEATEAPEDQAENQPAVKTKEGENKSEEAESGNGEESTDLKTNLETNGFGINEQHQIIPEKKPLLDPKDPILQISKMQNRDLPPVAVAAHNTIKNLKNLETINQRLKIIHKDAESANSKVQESSNSKVSNEIVAELEIVAKNCELYKTKAKALYRVIKEDHAHIAEMEKDHKVNAEKERKAEIEAEKLKESQEREQREQEEKENLSQTEMNNAKDAHDNANDLFLENDFDAIVKSLNKEKKSYQTAAGRNALQVYIDRYEYVVVMRDVLIECINGSPFSWGWGRGSTARDITKASKRGISIKDSTAIYPWKSVGIMQMLKLANHYISDKKTTIAQKQKIAIGAAVFCDEFGEKGREKSKLFLSKAINYGFKRKEAERIFEYDL